MKKSLSLLAMATGLTLAAHPASAAYTSPYAFKSKLPPVQVDMNAMNDVGRYPAAPAMQPMATIPGFAQNTPAPVAAAPVAAAPLTAAPVPTSGGSSFLDEIMSYHTGNGAKKKSTDDNAAIAHPVSAPAPAPVIVPVAAPLMPRPLPAPVVKPAALPPLSIPATAQPVSQPAPVIMEAPLVSTPVIDAAITPEAVVAVEAPIIAPAIPAPVAAPVIAAPAAIEAPVIKAPPAVTAPVIETPVIATPDAIEAPVIDPPAVATAPKIEAPVITAPAAIEAPVIEPPAAVTAPVIDAPVIKAPAIAADAAAETPVDPVIVPAAVDTATEQPPAVRTRNTRRMPATDAKADLTVAFTQNSSALSPQEEANLAALAASLAKDPNARLQLRAYATDAEANATNARRMSLSRGLLVRAYLIEKGISPAAIDVRALGMDADKPADTVDVVVTK